MALIFIDGFECYCGVTTGTTSHSFRDAWTAGDNPMIGTTYGRFGGMGMRGNYLYGHTMMRCLGLTRQTLIGGIAVKPRSYQDRTERETPIGFSYYPEGRQMQVSQRANGAWGLFRGDTPSLIETSDEGFWTLFEWGYLEFYLSVANSGGRAIVKYNGKTVIDYTGDTQGQATALIDTIFVQGMNSHPYFDDMYLCDDLGGINDGFLGDVCAERIDVDGDGNHTEWDVNTGNRWEAVDDPIVDYDTTYVYTDIKGEKNSFSLESSSGAGDIKGVGIKIWSRRDDSGEVLKIREFVRLSGSDYNVGNPFPISDSYLMKERCLDQNPADSQPFEDADITGLEVGMQLVTTTTALPTTTTTV